ncbi:hypothetical protein SRHO_G00190760 [Serrasalmus rhombeus]
MSEQVGTSQSAPSVPFVVSQCSPSDDGLLTLGCLTSGFLPAESLRFSWTDGSGGAVSDAVQYPAVQTRDGKFTAVSHVRVQPVEGRAKTLTCRVEHLAGSQNKDITLRGSSPPTIRLVEFGQSIMCVIEDFYPKPLSIKWKKDDREVRGRDWKTTENDSGSYRAVSVLDENLASSSPGTKYICEVTHGGKTYSDNLTLRAQFALKINPPPAKELFINKKAVLKCVLSGDSRKEVEGATVSWTVGGRSPATRDVGVGGVTQAGSAFTKTTTLTLEESVWFSGSEVICSTSRDQTAPEKISVKRGGQRPSIVIYKPDKTVSDSDSVSLVCEVSSSDLANVYIMWKVNGGQYIEGNSMTTIKNDSTLIVHSYLTVTGKQYNSAEITCAVKDANIQNDFQPRTSSPSKTNSSPTIRLVEIGQSIMCIIKNFYPKSLKIKWKKDDREVRGRDWKTTENDSGSYRAVSVLEANLTSLSPGSKYTCEVTHGDKMYSDSLSYKANFYLKINPPQAKDLFVNKKAVISCVITGDNQKEVEGATVSWTAGGRRPATRDVGVGGVTQAGSAFTKTSTLTLEESVWFSGDEVICSTSRDQTAPEKISVKRGGQRPSIVIYKPDKTVSDSDKVSLVCEVSSSDLANVYIMWLVNGASQSAPSVPFVVSQCSPSDDGFVTLGCLTTGFLPAESLRFSWTDGSGGAVSDAVQYPAVQTRDGKFTAVSHVRVQQEQWKEKTLTCRVEHPAGSQNKDITVGANSPPTIRLVEFGQSIMCIIEDFYPKSLRIKWKKDDREVRGRDWKTTENDSGSYRAVSVLEANLASSSPGTKYTCEVTHGGKTYSDNLSSRVQSSLKINPPPAKELFINQRAVLECVLSGDSRKEVEGATVSWTAGGRSPATRDVRVGGVTQAGSAFTKTSTLTLEESVWFSGTEVICYTSVDQRTASEKISVKRGGQRPSIVIYKPDKTVSDSDSVSLVCEVSSSDLANVYVMWKVNGGQYIEGNSLTTINKNDNKLIVLSYLTVTGQQYNSAEITCAVKDANIQNDFQPRTSSPSKTNSPPTIRLVEFGQSIMCIIEDFYPKSLRIKWKKNDREVRGRDWKTTENDSGSYRAVSVLEVNLASSSPGTKYTCEVTHEGKTYSDNLSSRVQSSLKINPPPAKELFINKKAVIECVLSGDSRKEVEGATVSWTAGGRSPATRDVRVGGVTQAGSAFTKTSTLTLEESVWFSGTEVICSTSVDQKTTSDKISVKRGGQRPSIVIYKPDKTVSDSDSVSLVCEFSSSDLANVYVMWKVNGGQYIEGNSLTTIIQNYNTLIVLSYLTVTGQQYNSAEITCAVKDANIQNDFQPRTSSPSKTNSPPTIRLVEFGQSIMCIIEDFYPKSLRIKWKKDDREVRGRDWKTTENDSGSYRAVSVLEENLASSSPGTKYTCEVTHEGRTYSDNLSSRVQSSLKINPPPAKELFINQRAVIECVLNGDSRKEVEGATVSWTVGGSPVTRDVRVGGVTQAGSAFTKTSTLTLEESVWFSGTEVICYTSVDQRTASEKISVKRGGQRPSIVIYKPDKTVSDSDSVSLVCEVSSSDLANAYIMWQVNNGQYTEGNSTATIIKKDNTLIVLSYLTVTGKQYNSEKFACAVKDANMKINNTPAIHTTSLSDLPWPDPGWYVQCDKDPLEEDEFNSLWSTASSFIFLFLFSLLYSTAQCLYRTK